jgi:P-type conjugative transfer protein TrbJ
MKSTRLSILCISLAAALGAWAPQAVAGTLTGGATLPEQIVQEATSVEQLAKNAAQVQAQLQTVYNQLYNLRQLNPTAIAQLVGFPITDLQGIYQMVQAVQGVQSAYTGFAQQLQKFQFGAQQMNMTPSQYLTLQAQAAVSKGGMYQQVYTQQTAAINNLQTQMQNLQQTASTIPGITSQIGGLQNLMNQNVQMQAQMISLNQVAREQLQLAAMKRQQNAADAANAATDEQQLQSQQSATYTALQNVYATQQAAAGSMTLTDPSAFNPTVQSSGTPASSASQP